MIIVGAGDDRGFVVRCYRRRWCCGARRLTGEKRDDEKFDLIGTRIAEGVRRTFQRDVIVFEIAAKTQHQMVEIRRWIDQILLRHCSFEKLLKLQLIIGMNLLEENLVQQFVTFVADDRCATLIDEENFSRFRLTTTGEFRGERVQRRNRTVGQIVDVRRRRILNASDGDKGHLTVGIRRGRMMMMMKIEIVMIRCRMIVQIANVSADVHNFVEMPVDRRSQRRSMPSTQNRRIDERIRMISVESIRRADAQTTNERTFRTN